jgi:hypothetical protein
VGWQQSTTATKTLILRVLLMIITTNHSSVRKLKRPGR